MSLLGTVTAAPADSHDAPDAPHRPCLVAVIKRVSLSLLIACVIPATLFYVCLVLSGVWTAIVAALVWSYGAIVWRKVTRRRTSGLLILTAVLLTGRTAISLVADSTFLYFLQPIISDGIVATAFLLSLASARPLVARLAGDFYPMDHELHLRPRIQRLFWWLTAMWAAICIGRALTSLWLLNSQSLETFVLVKSIFMLTCNIVAVAVTIGASVLVARKEGLMGPRLAPVAA
jgi:intracellular septation protein A